MTRVLSFFAYGFALSAARILPIAVIFVIAGRLSEADFGRLAIIVTSLAVVTTLTDAGTDVAATLLAARESTEAGRDGVLGSVMILKLGLALTGHIVILLPAAARIPSSTPYVVGIAVLYSTAIFLGAVSAANRVRIRVERRGEPRAMMLEKVMVAATFALSATLVTPNLGNYVLAHAGASAIGPLCALLVDRPVWRRASVACIRRLLLEGMPLAVSALSAVILWRGGVYWLEATGGLVAAGVLTAAFYPVQAISTVPLNSAPQLLLPRRSGDVSARGAVMAAAAVGAALSALTILVAMTTPGSLPYPLNTPDGEKSLVLLLLALPALWVNPLIATGMRARGHRWPIAGVQLILTACALAMLLLTHPSPSASPVALLVTCSEWAILVSLLMYRRLRASEWYGS